MSIHGCSLAEYAKQFSGMQLKDTKYLGFRDVPDLLQKYTTGNKALDFGCGPGKTSVFLEKLGFIVDGVDINEHMVELARKAFPESNFRVIEEGKIPTADEHYDLVFTGWVLHDIGPKDKLLATLLEITRVLKKGGTFLAITLSETVFGRDWNHVNTEFEENKNLKSGDRVKILFKESNFIVRPYFWTENDYRDVLRDTGLELILVHKPLGRDDEGFDWTHEKEIPRYKIYVAKKR